MPVSSARISWVLRAMRIEAGVGKANASSNELVCNDWVPPSTAASASIVVRMMLLCGSCSVRLTPEVWQCVRRARLAGFFGTNCCISRAHNTRAARSFAISMKKFMPIPKKNDSRGANSSIASPRDNAARTYSRPSAKSEGQFLNRGRAGFLHVIAGDRDRVEFRHVPGGVFDDVGDDAHRRPGRVDIGVADHELFEDVVLDRAGELVLRHTLLLGGDDVAGEHRQDRAVHRHRHAHPVERDAVEQDLHVLDRVDRHPGLADIADDPRMVAVIAAMGGEIEGDRQPHLPGRQIVAIEAVRLLGGRKPGILPDRPRPVGVHRRPRTPQIGRKPGHPRAFDRGKVLGGVERLDPDALRGDPVEAVERLALQLRPREARPVLEGLCRKGAVIGHCLLPRADQDYMGAGAFSSIAATLAHSMAEVDRRGQQQHGSRLMRGGERDRHDEQQGRDAERHLQQTRQRAARAARVRAGRGRTVRRHRPPTPA